MELLKRTLKGSRINKKKYIQISNKEKQLLLLKSDVSQVPLLSLFTLMIFSLFLMYYILSCLLMTPICFYSHKDINALFLKVSNKLHKINKWFISNTLSLNIKKKCHKQSKKDDIPLLLPKLKINNYEIKFPESI